MKINETRVLLLISLMAICSQFYFVQTVDGEVLDDWPMFGHDPSHSGVSDSVAPDNNLLWSYDSEYVIISSPSIYENNVYIGLKDRWVYCLNAYTGEIVWTYQTGPTGVSGPAVGSSPAVVNDRVYIGADDGGVYCLDTFSGKLIWRYQTGDTSTHVRSSPNVINGRVFVTSYDEHIYCLDADTGEQIWNYEGWFGMSSPAIENDKVYVASLKEILCLSAISGDFIWSYSADVAFSPSVSSGKVYIGSQNERALLCLDAETGSLDWIFDAGGSVRSSPAIAYGNIYFGLYAEPGTLYCLNAISGELVWSYDTGEHTKIWSSPAISDGGVYFGTTDTGEIYCLDALTGAFEWSYVTGDGIISSPAIARERLFIGSGGGVVYSFGPYEIWASDIDGYPKTLFNKGTSVYVSVPSLNVDVDFYVAKSSNWVDGDILSDVTGTIETIQLQPNIGIETHQVWNKPKAGSYDIIMDVNRNGEYDEAVDYLDSINVKRLKDGFIIIKKEIDWGYLNQYIDDASFKFESSWGEDFWLKEGRKANFKVEPGSYEISEVLNGWSLSERIIEDPSGDSYKLDTDTVILKIAEKEKVTVTFINRPPDFEIPENPLGTLGSLVSLMVVLALVYLSKNLIGHT
ncbi:PQQ-binding-like beta-propeller repeat protein [Thermoproteota archaeon]